MEFKPETDREIEEQMCLAEGNYDCEVFDAIEKVSKNGNPMIELQLRVFADDGSTRLLRDWLLASPSLAKRKLSRFCRSVGLDAEYESGHVTAEDCIGRSGRCVIKREHSDTYGLQPKVDTYEPADGPLKPSPRRGDADDSRPLKTPQEAAQAAQELDDNDIPF